MTFKFKTFLTTLYLGLLQLTHTIFQMCWRGPGSPDTVVNTDLVAHLTSEEVSKP